MYERWDVRNALSFTSKAACFRPLSELTSRDHGTNLFPRLKTLTVDFKDADIMDPYWDMHFGRAERIGFVDGMIKAMSGQTFNTEKLMITGIAKYAIPHELTMGLAQEDADKLLSGLSWGLS